MKLSNYYEPTPKKLKKLGDTILIGTASLSAMMMGAPFTDTQKAWIIFSLNVVGVVGKMITNLFKEDDKTEQGA